MLFRSFKELTDKKKTITDGDIEAIVKDNLWSVPERFSLDYCFVMSTATLAAIPVVSLDKAVYVNDGTIVNLSAIAPYREVEFQYEISADTSAITYRYFIQTGNQNISGNGSCVGSISPLAIKTEFASMEAGKISLFVYDSDSGTEMSETQLQAVAGIPPVVHVTGLKLRDAGNPLEEPASHIEMMLLLVVFRSCSARSPSS